MSNVVFNRGTTTTFSRFPSFDADSVVKDNVNMFELFPFLLAYYHLKTR